MKTAWMLTAFYDGQPTLSPEVLCRDFFQDLSPAQLIQKITDGEIELPLIEMDVSNKSSHVVHVLDLAVFIDGRRAVAQRELELRRRRARKGREDGVKVISPAPEQDPERQPFYFTPKQIAQLFDVTEQKVRSDAQRGGFGRVIGEVMFLVPEDVEQLLNSWRAATPQASAVSATVDYKMLVALRQLESRGENQAAYQPVRNRLPKRNGSVRPAPHRSSSGRRRRPASTLTEQTDPTNSVVSTDPR